MVKPIGPAFYAPYFGGYIIATGGTVSFDGDYKIHKFISPLDFFIVTFVPPGVNNSLDLLCIAGAGGGAGPGLNVGGGGGGAGGMKYIPNNALLIAATNTITAGPGGSAGAASGGSTEANKGTDSSISGSSFLATVTSTGGGGGGLFGSGVVGGGSGGGVSGAPRGFGTGIPGQGHDGSDGSGGLGSGPCTGGGGGGAGSAGGNLSAGAGLLNAITGSNILYCAGGVGAPITGAAPGPTPILSGNGGAGCAGYPGVATGAGQAGSDGFIYLRYKFQN